MIPLGKSRSIILINFTPSHRVTEIYDKGEKVDVPSPNDLIGSNKWRDVSTDLARYELR